MPPLSPRRTPALLFSWLGCGDATWGLAALRRCGPLAALLAASALAACGGSTDGTGGSGAGGSGSGSGGSGERPALCQLPLEGGTCNGYSEVFGFDSAEGRCRKFIYGLCEGNENRFGDYASCQAACGGPAEDGCDAAADCTLVPVSCCGACEPSALEDWRAVRQDATSPECQVACAPCPPPEGEPQRQHFGATCDAGRCVAYDVRRAPQGECTTDSNCRLRLGLACCEGCGGDDARGWVAVAQTADFCGNASVACPACAAQPPEDQVARCVAGQCQVQAL